MKILDVTAPEDDEFIRLIAWRDVLWHCPVLSSKGAYCSHIQEDSMKTKEVSKQRFLPKLAEQYRNEHYSGRTSSPRAEGPLMELTLSQSDSSFLCIHSIEDSFVSYLSLRN